MSREKQTRHTCIKCGSKRYRSSLTEFSFHTWLTPVTESTSYHFACNDNEKKTGFSCYEALIDYDLNCVIMPYSRPKKE